MDVFHYAAFAAAIAGLGLVAFLALAVFLLEDLRNPATAALATGLLALAAASCLEAFPFSAQGGSLQAIAVSALLDAMIAPALYIHLLLIVRPGARPRRLHGLLPLATAAAAGWFLFEVRDNPTAAQLQAPDPGMVAAGLTLMAAAFAVTIAQGVYILAARRLLSAERGAADTRHLRWARRVVTLSAAIWGFGLLVMAAGIAGVLDEQAARLAELPTTAALYLFGLAAVSDRAVLSRGVDQVVEIAAPAIAKYRRSALADDAAAAIVARAERALERDRLYADPNLSLSRLAAAAGAKANELSQALNRSGSSYADFVGRRRIQEACRLLDEAGPDRSVLAIALEVGFNAKSTFHTAFQRVTGMTPSAWRARRSSAGGLSAPAPGDPPPPPSAAS